MARQDSRGTVKLFGQHHPDQPVWPSLPAEREAQVAGVERRGGEAVRPPDQERRGASALIAPKPQPAREVGAGEIATLLVEGDDRGAGWDGGQQQARLGGAPALWRRGVLGLHLDQSD